MTDKFKEKNSISKRTKLKKVIEKPEIDPKAKEANTKLNSDSVSEWNANKTNANKTNANESKAKLPKEKKSIGQADRLDHLKAKAKAARSAIYKAAKERLKADPKFKELMAKKRENQKAMRKELLQKRKIQVKQEKTKHLSREEGLDGAKQYPSWPKQNIPKNGRTKYSRSAGTKKIDFDGDNSPNEINFENKFFNKNQSVDRGQGKHASGGKNAEAIQLRLDKTTASIQRFTRKVEEQTSRSFEDTDVKNKRSNSKPTDKTKPQKEILLRTGSNSELRTLGEIIAVDFINKKRKKSDKKP